MKANANLAFKTPASNCTQNGGIKLSARILIAEDDADIRRFNTEALLHAGYEVDEATNGIEAWHSLQTTHYVLLITDNMMPKLTGVGLLQKLRAAQMTLPVIIATGRCLLNEPGSSVSFQPDLTLLKPYTTEALLIAVATLLRKLKGREPSSSIVADKKIKADHSKKAQEIPQSIARRILVVDEDQDIRRLFTETLSSLEGYQIDTAAGGDTGWEALQLNNYHLLITEHDLPNLTGLELVKKIRSAHMELPVVMVAGRLPTIQLAQNPTLQLAATIEKPFPVEVLLNTVKEILSTNMLLIK